MCRKLVLEIMVTLDGILVTAHHDHHYQLMMTLPWHSCLEPRGSAEVFPKGLHLLNYHYYNVLMMMDDDVDVRKFWVLLTIYLLLLFKIS